MAVHNTQFAPWNSSVTTDNVEYKLAYGVTMFIVVGAFIMFSFSWHFRSASNLLYRDEYRTQYTPAESSHPFLDAGWGTWLISGINPFLSMCFAIGFLLWSWIIYSEQSNGYFIPSRDILALYVTSTYGTWLVVVFCASLVHIHYLRQIIYAYFHNASQVTVGGISISSNEVNTIINYLVTLKGHGFMGINGCTHIAIRKTLLAINVIWGLFPLFAGSLGASWDRSANDRPNRFIPNVEAGLVGATGIILTLNYFIYLFGKISNCLYYYSDVGYYFNPMIDPAMLDHETKEKVYIGFSSDILGPRYFLKGLIPQQYISWLHIFARVSFTFAVGFIIFNDVSQAVVFFFLCGFLPLYLTLYSEEPANFIAYEISAYFFTYIIAYWLQGVAYWRPQQQDYNLDLLTLNQSATYPGMEPFTQYGTSIITIDSLSFILAVLCFFQVVFMKKVQYPGEKIA